MICHCPWVFVYSYLRLLLFLHIMDHQVHSLKFIPLGGVPLTIVFQDYSWMVLHKQSISSLYPHTKLTHQWIKLGLLPLLLHLFLRESHVAIGISWRRSAGVIVVNNSLVSEPLKQPMFTYLCLLVPLVNNLTCHFHLITDYCWVHLTLGFIGRTNK